MAKKNQMNPADYIVPLYMNGMHGRMLHLPPPKNKKREILIVYGLHASIERMLGVAEDLNKYGAITLPDLPGFGGMESFYKIGEEPTLDNMADYLAAFIKLRYKRKTLTIIGMSYGFLVVTRMLQKYPEIARKVDIVISMVGFAHHEDFTFSRRNRLLMKHVAKILSRRMPAWIVRYVFLQKIFIKATYRLVADKHAKLKDANPSERNKRINFEVVLWHCNDVRTYMYTMAEMLNIDLCNRQVSLPVYHVEVRGDRYLDNRLVELHLGVIYQKINVISSKMPAHAPTVIADANAAAPFMPAKLRRVLARNTR